MKPLFVTSPESQATKFHMAIVHVPDGGHQLAIGLTDAADKTLGWGICPRADWEKMKKVIDEGFMAHDIDCAAEDLRPGATDTPPASMYQAVKWPTSSRRACAIQRYAPMCR